MPTEPPPNRFVSQWHRATAASPAIHDPHIRTRVELLASLLLSGTVLFVGSSLLHMLLNKPLVVVLAAFMAASCLVGYLLSRTRWHTFGALTSTISITLSIFILVYQDLNLVTLGALPIVVLLASFVLPWHAVLLVAAAQLAGMMLLHAVVPGFSTGSMVTAGVFQIIVAALAIVIIISRERTQRRIDHNTGALHQSEARYRALFEQASDAIFLLNLDGQHIDANPPACALLGYTCEELLQIGFRQVVVAEEHQHSLNILEALLSGESVPVYERHFRRKNGEIFPVEINVSLIRTDDGKPIMVQSVARDISERKRIERERLELETQRARVDELRRFISTTSHDLRTPLSIMNTSVYLLQRKLPPEWKNLAQLTALAEQTEHLQHVLETFDEMAQLDDREAAFQLQAVDLQALAEQVVEAHEPLARRKSHTLLLVKDARVALVHANEPSLYLALKCLVKNALNYTPNGGTVRVSVQQMDGHAVVEVQDNGVGIAPEALPFIFDRFYRADDARSVETGGTGLGLTIARRIVEAHRGTISVESQPGQGSCFRIQLPTGT